MENLYGYGANLHCSKQIYGKKTQCVPLIIVLLKNDFIVGNQIGLFVSNFQINK